MIVKSSQRCNGGYCVWSVVEKGFNLKLGQTQAKQLGFG